ncbi:MAG TPA: hypothetical protein PLP05_08730 [Sedimentisphaerales bacterium]|nr:hypothetical protein [Sedimentisphaerales bacterium]
MNEKKLTKRVRIDERLLEQIDYYSALFPKGIWTRESRTNYCTQLGLASLLVVFEDHSKQGTTAEAELNAGLFIQDVLRRVEKMNLPQSDVKRLLNVSLYGESCLLEAYKPHSGW